MPALQTRPLVESDFCSITADYIRSYGLPADIKTDNMHAAYIFTGNETEVPNKRSTSGSADTETTS
jgi:hypothetical protein